MAVLYTKKTKDSADWVIVGSGAAGATAAKVLSEGGFSVIIIEEGPYVRTKDFGIDAYPGMKKMFRDMGAQISNGKAPFPIVQGKCVGGSTLINSAIAWRAPEEVIENWSSDYDLDNAIRFKDLDPHFDALDQALTVSPVDDKALGNHNSLFGEAADKLGFSSKRIRRYDDGCEASASCLTGCRSGKKMAMNVTFIPESLNKGAKLYHSTRVIKVNPNKTVYAKNLSIQAKRGVILAAGAVHTPGILKRSKIKNKNIGQNFQAHPGTSIIGKFDQDISMQSGATQGWNSTHFVKSHGFKLEALSLPPELLAMRAPFVGDKLVEAMMEYKQILNWALVVKAKAKGQIKTFFGKESIWYTPTPQDMKSMRDGYRKLSEMMFSVGAKEVWPCIHGMPVLKSADDLKFWETATLDPRAYSMMASHLFGSTRMGKKPTNSVVDLNFQVHDCPGIYILDSSVFPTNLGVNPQHTIMAVARLGASRLL